MGFQFEELVLDCTFEGFDCRDMRLVERLYGFCELFMLVIFFVWFE